MLKLQIGESGRNSLRKCQVPAEKTLTDELMVAGIAEVVMKMAEDL